MKENDELILDIFNQRKRCCFTLPNIDKDKVKLEFKFDLEEGEEWLLKHMVPTSLTWCGTKGKPIQVTANFEQYQPTKWELFRDWFSSKIYRRERYW